MTRPTRVLLAIAGSGRFDRVWHVSFLGPDGLQADEWKWAGVQRLRERDSEGGNGPRDALLHYPSIQNGYEDHRLVCRQPRRMVDRSQAAEAFRPETSRTIRMP